MTNVLKNLALSSIDFSDDANSYFLYQLFMFFITNAVFSVHVACSEYFLPFCFLPHWFPRFSFYFYFFFLYFSRRHRFSCRFWFLVFSVCNFTRSFQRINQS